MSNPQQPNNVCYNIDISLEVEIIPIMFESNRRGNRVWLVFMVLAALLFLGAGQIGALAIAGIISLFFMMLANNTNSQNRQRQSRPRIRRVAMSPSARMARSQASHLSDYDDYYGLQDVGLIADEPRPDGLQLRRVRLVSLDDEAIRPYIVVDAPRHGHPSQVIVRFEINDSAGHSQFVYEMDYYMRAGENTILPDYRLPLKGNERLNRSGKWDLHIWINGGLMAVHTFSVSPSADERRRQFGIDGEAQEYLEIEHDPIPLSLDELMSQQSKTHS